MPIHLTALQTCLLTILLLAGGCSSLDPAADIERAGSLAAPRIQASADVEAALQRNPTEPPTAWTAGTPLDAESAVLVALERDPYIRVAMEKIAIQRAQMVQAELPPNPVVGLAIGAAIDGNGGTPAMVAVMQQLTWLWRRPFQIDAANAERKSAILAAANQAVILSGETRAAHATALAAQERIGIRRDYRDLTERTLFVVKRLAEEGEGSQLDVDRALRNHAQADADLQAALRDLELAQIELLAIMCMPNAGTDWELLGELDSNRTVPSETELLERARILRFDMAQAVEAVNVTLANTGLAETRKYPEVGFNLRWERMISGREAMAPGAEISLPIFDNGDPAIAAAHAELRVAELLLLEAEHIAVEETRTALARWQRSEEQARLYRSTVVRPAIAAQERSDRAYAEGVADLTVVLLAQKERLAAELRLLDFEANATTDRINLELAVGGSFDIPLEPPLAEAPNAETDRKDMNS